MNANRTNYVSIITRTKDRPLLIWRCIESVLNQTHQNWTHIIVNDGGDSQRLDAIISKYATRYHDRIKIIHCASVGVSRALNIGMKASNSDYVITHDDDDSWEPKFFERMIAALAEHKKINPNARGIICHTTAVNEYIDGERVIEKYRYSFNGWVRTVALTRLSGGNFIPPISFLFEQEVFSQIGFFNEAINLAEDWEFYLRFLSRFEIAVLPEHLANYHFRMRSTDEIYANTVTRRIDAHAIVGTAIQNDLIRRDLDSGKFGLGYLVALSNRAPFTGTLKHKLWGSKERMFALWNIKTLARVLYQKYLQIRSAA